MIKETKKPNNPITKKPDNPITKKQKNLKTEKQEKKFEKTEDKKNITTKERKTQKHKKEKAYPKKKQIKQRSKRYQALKKKIQSQKYSAEDAVKLVRQTSNTKFDESIEVHVRLGINMSKSDQHVRGSIKFPNPTGKKIKIAAFVEDANQKKCKDAGAKIIGGEELISKIKTTKKCDFDISVAEPKMMPKLGQIAKILGPKGLMPTPKNQTISPAPDKIIKDLMSGKTTFKNDSQGIVHLMIGKASLDEKKLAANLNTFLDELKKSKPEKLKGDFIKSITICSTMGPGIKIKI